MTTEKQIQANRRNALKSTGPKSAEGKDRASRNALRHGLTAEQAVLPHEDPRHYDEIRAGMIDAHAPRDSAEVALVEELVNAYWRLLRLHRVENHYWGHLGGCYNRGDEGVAEALIQTPETQTRNFFRYYGQIERSYYRALAAVNQFKRTRGKENGFVSSQDAPVTDAGAHPIAAAPNGFVSNSASPVEHRLPAVEPPLGSVPPEPCYSEGVLIEARVP